MPPFANIGSGGGTWAAWLIGMRKATSDHTITGRRLGATSRRSMAYVRSRHLAAVGFHARVTGFANGDIGVHW